MLFRDMNPKELEFENLLRKYLINRYDLNDNNELSRLSNSSIKVHIEKKVSLYLRLWFTKRLRFYGFENVLIIAQIEFENTRIGNGTDLLRFLVQHADKFSYKYIGVESACSEKMECFCRKFGFKEVHPSNYLIEVSKLAKELSV